MIVNIVWNTMKQLMDEIVYHCPQYFHAHQKQSGFYVLIEAIPHLTFLMFLIVAENDSIYILP